MGDLTERLVRLADPPLAPPDPQGVPEPRGRVRRRRRAAQTAVAAVCTVAVGLPVLGLLTGGADRRPVVLETSQTTVAPPAPTTTVPPTPDRPSGRFLPTWLPGALRVQTEEERPAVADEGQGWSRTYVRAGSTGVQDVLTVSLQNQAPPLDVDAEVAHDAGARRIQVQGRPGLLLPQIAARQDAVVVWSPGAGQLSEVEGFGLTDDELSTIAQGSVPPPRLDATPLPPGFQEVIRRDGASLPPAIPRRYEIGTTPSRGPATNPDMRLPAVRVVAVWGEPLPTGDPVPVRGRPGVVSTNGFETSVAWLERPDLLVTAAGTNLGVDDVVRIAGGLREQSLEEVLERPSGARVVLARGELGGIPYELRARGGSPGACLELARGSLSITCNSEVTATVADLSITIGMGVAFGPVDVEAAGVRLEVSNGEAVSTEAVGAAAGLGAAFYVVALPPDFGRVVAVVALGPDGQVLRRTAVG